MRSVEKCLVKRFWLVVVLVVLMAGPGQAVEIKGVRFSETLVVEQSELKLHGVAVLKWAMLFDVYAGAFYLPSGVSGATWLGTPPGKENCSKSCLIPSASRETPG